MIAVYMRPTSGSITTQYVHRDHQSSVVALTDTAGAIDQEFSFDAFGARRNTDWSADFTEFDSAHDTERGYTGHEHIDNARLIHMNGRVQDPIIGRMLSADPFIPNPFNSQSFNRYSYVINNPLSRVDPSGFCPADLNVPCTSNPGPGIGILDRISSPGHDEGGDIALENALADAANRNPWLAPYASVALGYGPNTVQSSTDNPTETPADPGIPPRGGHTSSNGGADTGFAWGYWLNRGLEAGGWALVGIDVLNSFISPTPDVGIIGASMITGARGARAPLHHLMTNKNWVSTLRGGPWSPRFADLAKKAGMTLDDVANKVPVPGHRGPHPEAYHQAIFDRLTSTTRGLSDKAYSTAFREELRKV